uniref:Uncharacterized protein n=1 Tax=Lepeophtheirus salmonis TaxID=72036 RepID=A0A0K2US09_LEPSM
MLQLHIFHSLKVGRSTSSPGDGLTFLIGDEDLLVGDLRFRRVLATSS